MTQDKIIEMAKHIATTLGSRMCDEHGDRHGEEIYAMGIDNIVDAIKLVAAAEREACAKMAENRALIEASDIEKTAHYTACKNIASQIRARDKT
jgi:hypothetical protein